MNKVFTVSVPEEILAALTAKSKESGVPRSRIVANAVASYIVVNTIDKYIPSNAPEASGNEGVI